MPRRPTEFRRIQENNAATTMTAVAGGRLLGCLLLLLASINYCSSQQYDHIQLSRITHSLETLTNSAQARERTSERLASGLMKMFSFLASDYLPCEEGWLKLGTSCYFISQDNSTWQGSREKCIARDSDLVKVTTEEEYNFLRNLVKGHHTWVGLNDQDVEGTYVWTDGTVQSIIQSWWNGNQPDNWQENENCIHFNFVLDDRWNDINCNRNYGYICEKSVFPIQG